MLEGMRRVLLCMPAAVESDLCLVEESEVPEVMRCMLEAMEGEFCLLEVPEVMRSVLLCML